jgi:hypothetical protein
VFTKLILFSINGNPQYAPPPPVIPLLDHNIIRSNVACAKLHCAELVPESNQHQTTSLTKPEEKLLIETCKGPALPTFYTIFLVSLAANKFTHASMTAYIKRNFLQ